MKLSVADGLPGVATAGFWDTLELTPLLDRPCQITFFQLTSEVPENRAYGGREGDRYQNQTHPLKHDR